MVKDNKKYNFFMFIYQGEISHTKIIDFLSRKYLAESITRLLKPLLIIVAAIIRNVASLIVLHRLKICYKKTSYMMTLFVYFNYLHCFFSMSNRRGEDSPWYCRCSINSYNLRSLCRILSCSVCHERYNLDILKVRLNF